MPVEADKRKSVIFSPLPKTQMMKPLVADDYAEKGADNNEAVIYNLLHVIHR